MSRLELISCLLIVVCVALVPGDLPAQDTPTSATGEVARLVGVLESDGPVYERAMACRRLSVIGDKTAVPALAAQLADARLATYARTALELIAAPEADEALRAAVARLDGDQLIGVIGSIGRRRDAQAVDTLTKLLSHENRAVATATAKSLGYIGNVQAADVLQAQLAQADDAFRPTLASACLIGAQKLQHQGDRERAIQVYQSVREAKVPRHISLAATGSEIVARGKDGLPLLVEQLQSEDRDRFRVGLQAARSLGTDACDALIRQFGEAGPLRQALLIAALQDIGDRTAVPVILKAAGGGVKDVRLAALDALARLGDPSAAPTLLRAAIEPDEEIAAAARAALAGLQGDRINQTIVDMLGDDDPLILQAAAALAGQRKVGAAAPTLLKLAGSSDANLRLAAIKSLGTTIDLEGLPQLIALTLARQPDDQRTAAREALQAACVRLPKDDCSEKLAAAMAGLPSTEKVALLEQIAAVGGPRALAEVVSAARSSDDTMQDAATRLLGTWMSPDAAPDLLDLAKTLSSEKYKIRALRGYIRIARQLNMTPADRVAACRTALSVAARIEEKKLALETLGRIVSLEAATLAATYLDDADLKQTAATAALAASEKVLPTFPAQTEKVLGRVAAAGIDRQLADRAKVLMARARELAEQQQEENDFTAIFDGNTFEGWEGNLDMFRIEDGAVVAGTLKGRIPRNEFLCTKKTYGDFELRLQFKVIGEGANAGIQLRSKRIPNHHEVCGYQADLGNNWWGCLYDESRRRKVLAGPPAEKRGEPVRMGEWNDYRMRCEGKRIQLWVNGVQTVDYSEADPNIEATGIIGLQVHSGGPMEAWYREIRIKEL